jgi:hypothetical protein
VQTEENNEKHVSIASVPDNIKKKCVLNASLEYNHLTSHNMNLTLFPVSRRFTRTLSHLCSAICSNTLAISRPTGTPLCIITGTDTPIQHHHGVRHYDSAHDTQHRRQEQFHWRRWHKRNLAAADTTTHRLHARYGALPGFTTVCQQQLTASIDSLHTIAHQSIPSAFLSALHGFQFVSFVQGGAEKR